MSSDTITLPIPIQAVPVLCYHLLRTISPEENLMHALPRLLAISLFTLSCTLHASDLAKEKRWAEQVVDAIMDGEAVWLEELPGR